MAEDRRIVPGLSFGGPDAPDEDELYRCVHCGFCLQACPTYIDTGLETESPRGRIALMKAVNEGRIGITPGVVRHWDMCIQCRACEVACPSGVNYGRLIESTMSQVERGRKGRNAGKGGAGGDGEPAEAWVRCGGPECLPAVRSSVVDEEKPRAEAAVRESRRAGELVARNRGRSLQGGRAGDSCAGGSAALRSRCYRAALCRW